MKVSNFSKNKDKNKNKNKKNHVSRLNKNSFKINTSRLPVHLKKEKKTDFSRCHILLRVISI
jgi:hypothetical protein